MGARPVKIGHKKMVAKGGYVDFLASPVSGHRSLNKNPLRPSLMQNRYFTLFTKQGCVKINILNKSIWFLRKVLDKMIDLLQIV